ncbi:MAG: HipA domain-containing protein [Bacteroidales bacterium]|nr:HipA domain-containing protein [Bacteroidales bacterium]
MKCLCCYKKLNAGEHDYHAACAKRWFGARGVPTLPYSHADIRDMAKQIVRAQTTVTGVQAKLSMDIQRIEQESRFTIVSMDGAYILKPQTIQYPHLPENEDLTMHLAQIAKIEVVPHILVRFEDGELCYLTKRIDRTTNGTRLPMEDMCQLTERLTERKYKGSYEQIAKAIRQYSHAPGLDLTNYWTMVLFCWLVGNSDMHLKNFSLYAPNTTEHILAPAYDLVNTLLAIPEDNEELALTLNGKKRKLTRHDFETAMISSGLNENVVSNIFRKFLRIYPQWEATIRTSFLPEDLQEAYWQLIQQRITTLYNTTQL